jgi:exodeoxyribonuclease V alpha subunit
VFNGDLGVIEKINRIEQDMVVSFEGRQVEYDFGDLDELALAYVLSIHKSQGSEFPCVVIPVHTQHYMMLQRNLLYTAVTRGRGWWSWSERRRRRAWRCGGRAPARGTRR